MVLKSLDRLIQHTRLECVTCGNQLVDCGATCTHCQTPLEVSRSVASRAKPARFLPVLGASGAGKTVYLGILLDMLSKGSGELHGLPNGAFSVGVQQQTMEALEQRRFPEKTPSEPDMWKWVHCEAYNQRSPNRGIDIMTPDLAGEAIALELEQPRTYSTIRTVMQKSEGVILLFDSLRVRDFSREEDMFGMKLVSSLASLHPEAGAARRRKIRMPIAVIFTKADCCAEACDDPHRFAAANMPGFYGFCKKKFSKFGFFAASVVGSSVTEMDEDGGLVQIPLHVEPRGIVEPLSWVMNNI